MKKLRIVAVLLLMLLLFVGCKPKVSDPVHSDAPGVRVEIVSLDLSGETATLSLKWYNNTNSYVTYDVMFDVEREVDGEWKACPRPEGETLRYPGGMWFVLEKGKPQIERYYIGYYFDVSEPGKYRICPICHVDGIRYPVWAEFEVKGEAEMNP